MSRLARLIAVLAVGWLYWRPGVVHASGCPPNYPELQFLKQREVFIGRVVAIEDLGSHPFPMYTATIAVRQSWKGDVPATVSGWYQELPKAYSGEPSPLVKGGNFIVYSSPHDGKYPLAPCARLVPTGIGAWHDVLLLTAWDLRVAVPVLIGLQVLLRWRERRMMQVEAGSV